MERLPVILNLPVSPSTSHWLWLSRVAQGCRDAPADRGWGWGRCFLSDPQVWPFLNEALAGIRTPSPTQILRLGVMPAWLNLQLPRRRQSVATSTVDGVGGWDGGYEGVNLPVCLVSIIPAWPVFLLPNSDFLSDSQRRIHRHAAPCSDPQGDRRVMAFVSLVAKMTSEGS